MDALIFDFDGVIVDSEPVHLAGFRRALGPMNVTITEKDYYEKYLGYDDRDCFAAVSKDFDLGLSEKQVSELTEQKSIEVQRVFSEDIQALPGAVELVQSAFRADIPLAICSGGLRDEILLACNTVGILDCFKVIVAADDVRRSKPDPESYVLARQRLIDEFQCKIDAPQCVVIEDSPMGIESAIGAGMHVLGVTNSCDASYLQAADRIVDSLQEVSLADIEALTR